MTGYLTTVKIQEGLFGIRFKGGGLIVDKTGTPLPSFASRKAAHEFIESNWAELKEYN